MRRNHASAAKAALIYGFYGTAEQLDEKVDRGKEAHPSWAKAPLISITYGTAEAVPFPKTGVFQQAVKPCPFKTVELFASLFEECFYIGRSV